ncbi:acyl-CoA synthetase [Streptomyces humidus]|uniref:Acyl-CoA synthetase n=1 Tax=Streptomyces humidus TaxID=52259 RepID=A0A918FT19_9ACTN|nr:acyl-CoA synthetase [Streptomyces humidus]
MPSLVKDTLSHHLAHVAALTPDETAFTFVDYGKDPQGASTSLTWKQLDDRVGATADGLRCAGAVGRRVAIVAPQGLEYIVGFLGAARAGAIAVPVFTPSLPGHKEKLSAVLQDASPALVWTVEELRQSLTGSFAPNDSPTGCRVITERDLRKAVKQSSAEFEDPKPTDLAYLQYTSGSTRVPSGVEITHSNVCTNARQALEAYDIRRGRNCTVGWLPLYHDMGLVLAVALPIIGHLPSVLMDPLAFIQQPGRWLRLLTRYPGAITAAPNFAYDYAVQRVGEEERAGLSLGSVSAMVNGSEPIAARTLERFQAAFSHAGMQRRIMRPSYGLAEATVFVCASHAGEEPTVTSFDRKALGQGCARVVEVAEAADQQAAVDLVACGRPTGQEIAVVDPTTCRRREEGQIGEIWLRGPNVGRGYWRRPDQSGTTFGAVLVDDGSGSWLRTGDLGVWHDKQLYVTGRLKDLVIVDGTNHYPHDIEETVQNAHPAVRRHRLAAFAAPTVDGERLVVVAEHGRELDPGRLVQDEVARAVRAAVATGHGLAVHDFVLVPPGSVPHTTSGKVARSACRDRYLAGEWTVRPHV